jgi:EAL domain-containing protein (putative c-di-GMP-specific phosphodiesterase class I)
MDTLGTPLNALDHAISSRDVNTIETVRNAIKHRNVLLAFQPVVQANAPDRAAFYEGLIRVMDDTGRIIPAREFIETVENTEYGRLLDCLALEKGLAELHRVPDLRLSINMSARSIGYAKWMRSLKRGLSLDKSIAERLILEITETSAMMVPELVVNFMDELQAIGISFAIDDFGSGYTALRHFKEFRFDILKIDGEFSRNIANDPDNQVLVSAMLSIAEQFDMFTVAEMVETAADAECLRNLGAHCLQGYYYAAPTTKPAWRAETEKRQA